MIPSVWAFIGARELQDDHLGFPLFCAAAAGVGKAGLLAVTGAAQGADQSAARLALAAGGRVRLFLPWPAYQKRFVAHLIEKYPDRVEIVSLNDVSLHVRVSWFDSVTQYHPNPYALTSAGRRLHARNAGIIHAAEMVVAIPSAPEAGGTGQGIRLARAFNKPYYDLSVPEMRVQFEAFLSRTFHAS